MRPQIVPDIIHLQPIAQVHNLLEDSISADTSRILFNAGYCKVTPKGIFFWAFFRGHIHCGCLPILDNQNLRSTRLYGYFLE